MSDDKDSAGVGPPPPGPPADGPAVADGLELDERQIQEMRSIFATSLPQYVDPLEQLCHQLLSGGGEEIFASFRAAATSLREAADTMSFTAVSDILLRLENAVAQLPTRGGAAINRDAREAVLGLILDLRQLSEELGASHEAIKGRALVERLAGLPGAAEIAARLARAGLVLDVQLHGARPDEIVAVSGLARAQVDAVLAWLAAHPVDDATGAPGGSAPAAAARGGHAADAASPRGATAAGAGAADDEAQRLADEIAALLAAIDRLGARLDEARVDAARSRTRSDNLKARRRAIAAEVERRRRSNEELERWLTAATALQARLLSQRDLYAGARRDSEHRLEQRRRRLAELVHSVGEQQDELISSREALEELDTMVREIRARIGREPALR